MNQKQPVGKMKPSSPAKPIPKSNAERQAALRKRRLDNGLTEVQGIYAKKEDHTSIKAYAKRLQKKNAIPIKRI
jgi:hypothetical protein